MVPVILLACLASDPAQCQKTQLRLSAATSYTDCQAQLENTVVLWSREHRSQLVQSAYCLPPQPGSHY